MALPKEVLPKGMRLKGAGPLADVYQGEGVFLVHLLEACLEKAASAREEEMGEKGWG
jgi:hypothetical protein